MRARSSKAVGKLDSRRQPVELHVVLCLESDVHARMVAKVLPDTRGVLHDGDPELAQVIGRPDAREHEQLRRGDGAGAEDDLLGLHRVLVAPALDLHAGGPVAVEQYAVHGAVGPDGQVEPVSRLAQVADCGAEPDAVRVVQRQGAYAGGIGVVVVWAVGEALGPAGVVEGLLVRTPRLSPEPVRHYRAVGAMEVVVECGVGLQPAKIGQQLVEAPLIVAQGGPAIVVLGDPSQEDLAVDGAGAARDLAPGDQHRLRGLGGFADEVPVVVAGHDVGGGGVAILQLVGEALEVRVVGPRLQQQHRASRVLAQARGQDRARRAGSDDDVVVLHGGSSTVALGPAMARWYTGGRRRVNKSGRRPQRELWVFGLVRRVQAATNLNQRLRYYSAQRSLRRVLHLFSPHRLEHLIHSPPAPSSPRRGRHRPRTHRYSPPVAQAVDVDVSEGIR